MRYEKNVILILFTVILSIICMTGMKLDSYGVSKSGTIFAGNSYVTMSPDGTAFTVGLDDKSCEKNNIRYMGYVHNVYGIRGPGELKEGQHYFEGIVEGEVPVAYWRVEHWNSACIHSRNSYNITSHGYSALGVNVYNCYRSYNAGWRAYCAVCGEMIDDLFFYITENMAASLKSLPSNTSYSTYFYLCPYDHSIENERYIAHSCCGISNNRYRIVYNGGSGAYGVMGTDYFYYDNAEKYEGKSVSPKKHLSTCGLKKTGYIFKGWSLEKGGEPDFGNGESWLTVQKKCNAKAVENDSVINLYAVWEPVSSGVSLLLGDGKLEGASGKVTLTRPYGTRISLGVPVYDGYFLTLNASGGKLENGKGSMVLTADRSFSGWKYGGSLNGKTDGKDYIFSSEKQGTVDFFTAFYSVSGVRLPTPSRDGYSFEGWYDSYGRKAGEGDSFYTPSGNEGLTARWNRISLLLSGNSIYSPSVNSGKGAVDLNWTASGIEYYSANRVYKSTDSANWELLGENGNTLNAESISRSFVYKGETESFNISETGVYSISLDGAEGGAFGHNSGGQGGHIELKLWLIKGETVSIECGGSGEGVTGSFEQSEHSGKYNGGYGTGGCGYGGAGGGGATCLYITETGGRKVLVACAGGGGGASLFGQGGPGGSMEKTLDINGSSNGIAVSSGTSGSKQTVSYSCGGGGGYYPGSPGTCVYERHVHSADNPGCGYHVHTGNQVDGGGCYTIENVQKESTDCTISCYYQGTSSYICQNPGCGRKGTLSSYCEYGYYYGGCWHYTGFTGYPHCPKCGDNNGGMLSGGQLSGVHTEYTEKVSYELGCGLNEGFNCTENGSSEYRLDGDGSYTSGGGGNWVLSDHSREFGVIWYDIDSDSCRGVHRGDGCAKLETVISGFYSDCKMNGVPASDLAPPDMVSEYRIETMGGRFVKVKWTEPGDKGTDYYFKIDNYSIKTGKLSSSSNIVKKEMVTGLKGYRIIRDISPQTIVKETGSTFINEAERDILLTSGKAEYLHVAAVDKAGNIGKTTHIKLDPSEEEFNVCWDIYTDKLSIPETENVHPADTSAYYVRADGRTPFYIGFGAYIDGSARASYQIGRCFFRNERKPESYLEVIIAESGSMEDGTVSADDISMAETGLPVSGYVGTEAQRSKNVSRIVVKQGFVAEGFMDGEELVLYPSAEADETAGLGETVSSSGELDRKNKIKLIFDGTAPLVTGLQEFNPEKLFIDGAEDVRKISIKAVDYGSGLNEDESYIRIYNKDNACEYIRYFDEGTAGIIELSFDKETMEELFYYGSFKIEVFAKDNVGNVTEEKIDGVGFNLDTDVVRLLEALDGKSIFARGESGDLHITSTGYVESVEVIFPEELKQYSTIYDYSSGPELQKEEVLRFMIPLYGIPEGDWEFTVTVIAHKGDETLESHPRVSVVNVSGSVLDELKTELE